MLLRNKTKTDITLPSRHVIKAGGSIDAHDGVILYFDNQIELKMRLQAGDLVLEEPKKSKPKDEAPEVDGD